MDVQPSISCRRVCHAWVSISFASKPARHRVWLPPAATLIVASAKKARSRGHCSTWNILRLAPLRLPFVPRGTLRGKTIPCSWRRKRWNVPRGTLQAGFRNSIAGSRIRRKKHIRSSERIFRLPLFMEAKSRERACGIVRRSRTKSSVLLPPRSTMSCLSRRIRPERLSIRTGCRAACRVPCRKRWCIPFRDLKTPFFLHLPMRLNMMVSMLAS